jgi:hypothetical protein
MSIKEITDLEECKKLWSKFSSNKSLWDLWEILLCFYNPNRETPLFIISNDDSGNIGELLPLCKDKAGEISFFGGGFLENRKIWMDSDNFRKVISNLNEKILLSDINADYISNIPSELKQFCNAEDSRYFLDLKKINHDFSNHLLSFSSKHRKNLLYDLRNLKKIGYFVNWCKMEYFDKSIELNKQRFGSESDYLDSEFVDEMKSLLSLLAQKNLLHTCVIVINDNVEAIEFGAFYNNIYYIINGGYNTNIPNLGKLLIMEHINKAISLKADEIDLMAGETGWKELWNFNKEPYYTLRLNSNNNNTTNTNKNITTILHTNNNINNNNTLESNSSNLILNKQPSQAMSVDSLKSNINSA